jgi:microcystin degradation protein MlrC
VTVRAIVDDHSQLALGVRERLARQFWDLREAVKPAAFDIDTALEMAASRQAVPGGGPIVLADVADNLGGGAAGDSTFILRRLFELGVGNAVVGALWDLGAVHICKNAGVGATLALRIGGKCGPASGLPVDLRVTVRAIVDDHSQLALGVRERLGPSVWIEAVDEGCAGTGLHIVLCSIRTQTYGTDAFTGLGITLEDKALVVVKSTQHFHAAFAPLARAVLYVTTPGAMNFDFAAIDYRRRSLDYWPRVADPHGWLSADPVAGSLAESKI